MNVGRRIAASTITSLAVAIVFANIVAAHGPDPHFSGRWNQNQALPFAWRSGSVPDATKYQPAIRAAAADASETRGSQAATFSYAAGASNLIGYGTGATCSPQGIACFTRNAPYSFTMWMREQGHIFDWGSLRWCQAYTTWPDGCFDVENIMLDEFGHVQILDHHDNLPNEPDYTDAVVQALSHAKPRAGWNAHAFGRCDVATLQMQYDMQGWGAKYSTCLDLATTLTLSANPSSLTGPGTTTLTAALKVADVSSYVRLAGNPVALRTVTLQRRAPGTSTWWTVGTMPYTSPSGSYALSVSVRGPTDYRAVFSKPADEGLRAAISPTVRVNVN